jgi:hypothetical protein
VGPADQTGVLGTASRGGVPEAPLVRQTSFPRTTWDARHRGDERRGYIYRLVGYLATGHRDSPVDTATAGARRIVVSSTSRESWVSPDARPHLRSIGRRVRGHRADDPGGVLWLSLSFLDRVDRYVNRRVRGPLDSSRLRTCRWIARQTGMGLPAEGRVVSYSVS